MGRAAVCALLIAALPVQASGLDGGELPPAVYAESARLLLPGGLWADSECFPVADGGTDCGGGWLPTPRLEAHGGEVARLRAENAALRASPPLLSGFQWAALGLTFVAGLVLGAWGGWTVARLVYGH